MSQLLIQITDSNCPEDECWAHRVPLETDKADIMKAIAVLYPTTTSVWIGVEDEEEE